MAHERGAQALRASRCSRSSKTRTVRQPTPPISITTSSISSRTQAHRFTVSSLRFIPFAPLTFRKLTIHSTTFINRPLLGRSLRSPLSSFAFPFILPAPISSIVSDVPLKPRSIHHTHPPFGRPPRPSSVMESAPTPKGVSSHAEAGTADLTMKI